MLPKPKHKYGYTSVEIEQICKLRGVTTKKFWDNHGVNTCAMSKDGKTIYHYICDVERTLHKLGAKDGKFHPWD
jgi:hypothetical protein